MDRSEETSKYLLSEVINLIDNNKILEVTELLEDYHSKDISDVVQSLDEERQIKLFEVLPLDMAASILDETTSEFFNFILSKISIEHKKNILELMSLDDMADILGELEEDKREAIIDLLSHEDAKDVKELLVYDEDSAGGIMTTGYIYIKEDVTVKDAINHIRMYAEDAETVYYIFIVDNDERLVGVLSLRELLASRDSNIIENIMSENVISVYVDEDREEAVKLVSKYDLLAIPVVDRDNKLKGIITVDDVIDVIEEEATEDMYKICGTSEDEMESIEQNNKINQIISSYKARIPWLLATLVGGFLSTMILYGLNKRLDPTYLPVIFFIPVILGMGGNIGTQASVLTVMALSNKHVDFKNVLIEGATGFFTGVTCSILIGILTFVFTKNMNLVLVVSISLMINMIIGAMLGAFVPVLFKKIDVDPAIVSTPLISTALDITGTATYFIIATLILSKIV